MLQYCPCITQLRHINHYIEPGEFLHLKALIMTQRGKGKQASGVGDRGLDQTWRMSQDTT